MDLFKDNKLLMIVLGFVLLNLVCFVAFKVVVKQTTNEVLKELRKPYSPSPYGPGFDPDKLPVEKSVFELRQLPGSESDWASRASSF